MKSFLYAIAAVFEGVWLLMKTSNIYAGAIPDATPRREYLTPEQWEHPTR